MKLINKDMTRESVTMFVSEHQIYARILCKSHGKWIKETYFQSYDWKVDEELINSSIKEITTTFGLKNPKVVVL